MIAALTAWFWPTTGVLLCGLVLAIACWDTYVTRRQTAVTFLVGAAYASAWLIAGHYLVDAFETRTTDSSHMSITTTKGEK